ncbi:amidohydrolase [Roseobacter sp. HKCCD9010]|uniref:N-formylglutamate amidohydrolase n=1 Tax=unclassified Roseobacter TaxID=196798 RepID=UPI0014911DCB|nr:MULTISPECIES: N-formylglutamate amidohydrolase [unclassified Roseobacter]MBF9052048.1 amidohydrolase [Rhodobacterales bacterium HKCCD4356]NNV13972.1 amidohydrolase [Roseobacter sp. HKCCD7357]NNV18213.1 amidohydrolase [Roseobacter sp. HKCCD8768]NNV27673.1 amidohydrolase [Roseobacter sp. HKCCD8192]NNV31985.1 amidohydrolase [Roseobacter sp. HKCCD9061]
MLSFPHSGDVYPEDFGYDPKLSFAEIDHPSDKYVDELFGNARALGLSTIKANFPRAYVDVNRHQHDIDAAMLDDAEAWPGRFLPSGSVEVGATLFWSKAHGTPIYDRKLSVAEAHHRLSCYFIPYHQTMTRIVERLRDQHGQAFIVDCHSMTQFDHELRGGKERPEIDIGTRNGASCDPALATKMAELFAARGYDVGMNKRFIGDEITLRYGWPEIDQHILQVELRRDLYMNEATRERSGNFAKVQADCAWVLAEFKEFVERRSGQAGRAADTSSNEGEA